MGDIIVNGTTYVLSQEDEKNLRDKIDEEVAKGTPTWEVNESTMEGFLKELDVERKD
jgi:hypothetical protein